VGSGSDTTGSSAGSMDLTARIDSADEGRSVLNGQSVVSLSGKAAAFGGRMVNSVADQILGQFAGNFAARFPAAAPKSTSASPAGASASSTGVASAEGAAATSSAPAASRSPTPASAPPPAAELNGLAAWNLCRETRMSEPGEARERSSRPQAIAPRRRRSMCALVTVRRRA